MVAVGDGDSGLMDSKDKMLHDQGQADKSQKTNKDKDVLQTTEVDMIATTDHKVNDTCYQEAGEEEDMDTDAIRSHETSESDQVARLPQSVTPSPCENISGDPHSDGNNRGSSQEVPSESGYGSAKVTPTGKEINETTVVPPGKDLPDRFSVAPPGEESDITTVAPPAEDLPDGISVAPSGKESDNMTVTPQGEESDNTTVAPKGEESDNTTVAPPGEKSDNTTVAPPGEESNNTTLAPLGGAVAVVSPRGKEATNTTVDPPGEDLADGMSMDPPGGKADNATVAPPGEESDNTTVAPPGEESDNTTVAPPGEDLPDGISVAPSGKESDNMTVTPQGEESDNTTVAPPGEESDNTTVAPPGEESDNTTVAPPGEESNNTTLAPLGGAVAVVSPRGKEATNTTVDPPGEDLADGMSMDPPGGKADNATVAPPGEEVADGITVTLSGDDQINDDASHENKSSPNSAEAPFIKEEESSKRSEVTEDKKDVREGKGDDVKIQKDEEGTNVQVLMDYRPEKNYDGDESSVSSSDSDSSVCLSSSEDEGEEADGMGETIIKNKAGKKKSGDKAMFEVDLRTKGEIMLSDLPPIEELKITVDETVVMQDLGNVSSVIGPLVIVQSKQTLPALDENTILFLEDRTPLGQVFETFGPVPSPLYAIRFNTADQVTERGIEVGTKIFYAPDMPDFTHFVFLEQLKRMRGSDASWEHNNEPPEKYLDYSDDEQERRAKARLRGKPLPENDEVEPNMGKKRKRKPRNHENGFCESADTPAGSMTESHGPPLTQWPPQAGGWPRPQRHSSRTYLQQGHPYQGNPRQGPPYQGNSHQGQSHQGHPRQGRTEPLWNQQQGPRPRGPPACRQPQMWPNNGNPGFFQGQGPPNRNPFRGSRPYGNPAPPGNGPRHSWDREVPDSAGGSWHGGPPQVPQHNLPMDMRFVQNVTMHENTELRGPAVGAGRQDGGQGYPPPVQFGGAPRFPHGPGQWY